MDSLGDFPTKNKKIPLLERFAAPSIADSVWTQRAELTLWYDITDKLVSIDVANNDLGEMIDLEKTFNQMCEEGALYQLNIPDFELISSQQACQYAKQGLNETLTFFTDSKGRLISFAYEVSFKVTNIALPCRSLITNTCRNMKGVLRGED